MCILVVTLMGSTSQLVADDDPKAKGPVSFADILENPDNIELNLRYAYQLIDEGRLRSAAATLERLLLLKPRMGSVRLLYALILYRLDSKGQALIELDNADRFGLLPDEKPLYKKLLNEWTGEKNKFKLSGAIGLSTSYLSNPGATPSSKQFEVLGLEFPAVDYGSTMAFERSLVLAGQYKFGPQNEYTMDKTLFYIHQDLTKELPDGRIIGVRGGLTRKFGIWSVTGGYTLAEARVFGDKLLTMKGLSLSTKYKRNSKWVYGVGVHVSKQDYFNTRFNHAATYKGGKEYKLDASITHLANAKNRWKVKTWYKDKSAAKSRYEYDEKGVDLLYTRVLSPSGVMLNSNLSVKKKHYGDDVDLSTLSRKHTQKRFALALSGPMSEMIPIDKIFAQARWRKGISKMRVNLEISRFHAKSNIIGYTYSNNEAKISLTAPFKLF